jgi:hypothetical protein
VWLAGFIPLPGLDPAAAAEVSAQGTDLGLLMLGVRPLLVAMVLVEIGALVLPRTRARRRTDPALRRVLWIVAAGLALPLAWMQGFGVALTLEQMAFNGHDPLVVWPGWTFRLGTASLLALTTAGFTLLARWIDRHGLGPGLAVLLLLDAGVSFAHALVELGRRVLSGAIPPAGALLVLGGLAAFGAAAAWALGRRPRWAGDLPAGLPVTGLLPLEWALTLLMVPSSLAALTGYREALPSALDPARPASLLPIAVIVLLASPVAATLYHWRRRAWWRGPERAAWIGLTAGSAALLLVLIGVDHLAQRWLPWSPSLGALSLLVGLALALDLWDECVLWRRAGSTPPRVLREDQDVADALEALDALRRDDPAGHYVLCGRRYRSLTYFFGPWVPLRIRGAPAREGT